MQKLPIGESDFKKLKEKNCYFVDKSDFIAEIIRENNDIILIPRPRRFGKTLNLSMLKYFFDKNENARDLFKGLKIETLPEFKEHQGKYPVIFLTFKDVKEKSFNIFIKKTGKILADIYKKYKDKLYSLDLDKNEKRKIESILLEEADYTDLQMALAELT
ncbi:AAA family ATPase, partial [Desulfonauticus submarinus]